MAIHAIGDVQGCDEELARLLGNLNPDPTRDEIWFVGDLVNRGPRSVEVLRRVRALGSMATVVLGNHDLHLLALAAGNRTRAGDRELAEVLDADDAGELVDWLRHRPLAHYRPELNTLMVHAGIHPRWDPLLTVKLAREVEQALRGPDWRTLMKGLYGDRPAQWSPGLAGQDRLRFIINCLTRLRACRPDGQPELSWSGPPAELPPGLVPWFEVPGRASAPVRVVFGHWSSLGLLQRENLLALDTGCVWGRTLTAARLDGPARIVSTPCGKHGDQPHD